MSTASITAILSDFTGLPPLAPPSVPAVPSFSDMLTSASSSLAGFGLLPTEASQKLLDLSQNFAPPSLRKFPRSDDVAVPIALPAPVQAAAAAAQDSAAADASPSSQSASNPAGAPPEQNSPTAASAAGAPGTGGSSAQIAGGVALPPIAAELGTRVALGAQALLSQPSQVLTTLPHGAPPTASTSALAPNLGAAAHGAAPDPATVLPKLATNAALGGSSPGTTTPALETALQTGFAQNPTAGPAAVSTGEAALLATTADTSAPETASGTAAAPVSVPLPAPEAAPAMESAAMPMIAASALDQVAASLSQGGKLGLSQIEIQLKPAALGAVDVKLELTHDGRVSAVISADRSDTLMQLQRGSGELQQALRDAGLQTDTGSLSFSLRGDPQTGDQTGRQPGSAQATQSSGTADDLLAAPAAAAGAGPSAHSGLLNIQV